MNKTLNYISLIAIVSFIFVSCSNDERTKQRQKKLFEYENYDRFKNWSISSRDELVKFRNQLSQDSSITFIVEKKNKKFRVKHFLTSDSAQFTFYAKLADSLKAKFPEYLIQDYFKLGYDEILYRNKKGNEFLIINNEKEKYFYFFKYDSLAPPTNIKSFKRIKEDWYKLENN